MIYVRTCVSRSHVSLTLHTKKSSKFLVVPQIVGILKKIIDIIHVFQSNDVISQSREIRFEKYTCHKRKNDVFIIDDFKIKFTAFFIY